MPNPYKGTGDFILGLIDIADISLPVHHFGVLVLSFDKLLADHIVGDTTLSAPVN
jgi:hypothetical protein